MKNENKIVSGKVETGTRLSVKPFPLMLFTIVLLLAAVIAFVSRTSACTAIQENVYPATLVIVEADHKEDCTGSFRAVPYSAMAEGRLTPSYEVSTDPEDLEFGDVIATIMSDVNGTPEIEDDKVISYRYVGYTWQLKRGSSNK